MTIKEPGSKTDTVRVTFGVPSTLWADQIHLVGDFNNWNPYSLPLEHSLHSGWRVSVELKRGRTYQYRFLVDKTRWCNDWNADCYIPNPFGGDNSAVET
jgi:1,4-alpha-glucan branching enzyme